MTDTSPVAKLGATLPKGNGLTRAVPKLFEQRGTLVPFVGLMRVDETGLDHSDVQHLRGSIQRFELALGPLAADAKDLITRCSTAATSVDGQQQLFGHPTDLEDDEERRRLVGFLTEWGQEQDPQLDVAALTEQWNSWHGGYYDARLEQAPVRYLREFCFVKGVIAEDPVLAPTFSDTAPDEPAEGEDEPEPDDTAA